MDIAPGADVTIKIKSTPSAEAGRKTLRRICAKDPAILKAHRYRKNHRPSWQDWQRGGRFWHHQMKSHLPVSLDPGATYNVRATLDVLRDLKSIARWVELSTK